MREEIKKDAGVIIDRSIAAVLPDEAVRRTLTGRDFGDGRVVLAAAGKAAWQMANTAYEVMGERIESGVVITKYGHAKGPIGRFRVFEAGHPVPDEGSYVATQAALGMVEDLTEKDTVIFLLSGGGSALFESPLISPKSLTLLTEELLKCGADITEINTIRKRLSRVKGGRFALACSPAKVLSVVLSDIIGDPLDMIASGPAYPDRSTCKEAMAIAAKYHLTITAEMELYLSQETPKELSNVETYVNGSVRSLVRAAADAAASLGYQPTILTDCLDCEAREAGRFLAAVARTHTDTSRSLAFIAGGETIVHLTGTGRGGRNQEIALAGGIGITGLTHTAIFSVGSDGTDGPTDAAGGYVDGETFEVDGAVVTIAEAKAALMNNDAYPLLKKAGGLIITGPTGTNVNDVSVVLIKR
ncbi:MAG: DUF4147 domain-containing protein [Lachnospiraceae bacterium]|nr:DUF4147 domain-containing protein [Lachnospiraceae bacterium]